MSVTRIFRRFVRSLVKNVKAGSKSKYSFWGAIALIVSTASTAALYLLDDNPETVVDWNEVFRICIEAAIFLVIRDAAVSTEETLDPPKAPPESPSVPPTGAVGASE